MELIVGQIGFAECSSLGPVDVEECADWVHELCASDHCTSFLLLFSLSRSIPLLNA